MKKMLAVILSLIMVISLSACGGSDKKDSGEEKTDENLTAYEYYHDAVRKYNDADSYDVTMDSKLKIKAPEFDMDMSMGGDLKLSGVNVEEKKVIYKIESDVPGSEKDVMEGFIVDGYSYTESDGEKRKAEMDFDEFDDKMNVHPIKFSSDLVEDQSVEEITDGKELHMKLKSEAIDKITFGMFGGVTGLIDEAFSSDDGEVNLKSISFVVTVTDELVITDLVLAANYDVIGDGEAGSLAVTFTEKFNKIGGVKFDIPKDLSDYKE